MTAKAGSKAPSANGTGGASRSKGKRRKFTFRGITLYGPPELPGTIEFDLGDIGVRFEAGDDQAAVAGMHRLLESLLDRAQLHKVRETIKGIEDPWQQKLLEALFAAYGTDSGKR